MIWVATILGLFAGFMFFRACGVIAHQQSVVVKLGLEVKRSYEAFDKLFVITSDIMLSMHEAGITNIPDSELKKIHEIRTKSYETK